MSKKPPELGPTPTDDSDMMPTGPPSQALLSESAALEILVERTPSHSIVALLIMIF
jgi:hypothetical protein